MRNTLEEQRPINVKIPSTRYLGSKRKILNWIWTNISKLPFDSFLDVFCGTSVVSFKAKLHGKQVYANDILKFNYYVALSIIENNDRKLTRKDLELILSNHPDISYPTFIQDTFKGIFYTDEENAWLDRVITNIETFIEDKYKKALAYTILGQACLVKRPFNLFHRRNLYMRLANIKRSFGNKKTWDTPFETHFKRFAKEYNAVIFDNGRENKAFNQDALKLNFPGMENIDLVYMDPPYLPKVGDKPDYHLFYHFLEGIVDYKSWPEKINHKSSIRVIKYSPSPWTSKATIYKAFNHLFRKFRRNKYLVLSYNTDGVPSLEELYNMLKQYKDFVVVKKKKHQYVLSTNKPEELLFIALDENPAKYGLTSDYTQINSHL